MLTFNPGPSKISDSTKKNIIDAINQNILEISHRSDQFSQISKQTIDGLRNFFNIPDNYKIFYTASATQAMQLSVMNCRENASFHFVNGAFSQRFFKISKLFKKKASSFNADFEEICDYNTAIPGNTDFITITHNETSTGYMCSMNDINKVRNKNREAILTVDITSSAGATKINIEKADIWLFSVQKCFGLPAGLGIIIVSPRAFQKSLKSSKAGIDSFESMSAKMEEKYQTIQTPNILNIYLLAKILKKWNNNGGLVSNIKQTENKYSTIENIIINSSKLDFFIKNKLYRSKTVVCIEANENIIKKIHKKAEQNNIILGKGYGKIKPNTFRIANFPAITNDDIDKLKLCLKL